MKEALTLWNLNSKCLRRNIHCVNIAQERSAPESKCHYYEATTSVTAWLRAILKLVAASVKWQVSNSKWSLNRHSLYLRVHSSQNLVHLSKFFLDLRQGQGMQSYEPYTSCSQRLLGRGYVQVQASFRWYNLVQDVFCWQSLLIQGLNLTFDAIFPRDAFHSSCHPKRLTADRNVTDSGHGLFAFPTQGPAGKGHWLEWSKKSQEDSTKINRTCMKFPDKLFQKDVKEDSTKRLHFTKTLNWRCFLYIISSKLFVFQTEAELKLKLF